MHSSWVRIGEILDMFLEVHMLITDKTIEFENRRVLNA